MGGSFFTMQHCWEESVKYPGACLTLVFVVGSSGPGSGLQCQPLVVEGSLLLLLGFFHCGKSRLPNYVSWSVLESLLLKALLPCAAECNWFYSEERRVKSSMDVSEGRCLELHLSGSLVGTWLEDIRKDLASLLQFSSQ